MKIYIELDGAPAKLLSVSDNVTVGEIRDALKASALEWYFDDDTYVRAADARQLSHLVADGLATSGSSASNAVKVQTIKPGRTARMLVVMVMINCTNVYTACTQRDEHHITSHHMPWTDVGRLTALLLFWAYMKHMLQVLTSR